MTTATATVPAFGDTAIIAKIIQDMRIEYDEDGHIIGSQEYFDAELDRLERQRMELEDDIETKDAEISRLKQKYAKELEPFERVLDDMQTALVTLDRRIGEAYCSDDAPTEAELLDIWPNPPYGASLFVSLFDEPAFASVPPYGASLVENLL